MLLLLPQILAIVAVFAEDKMDGVAEELPLMNAAVTMTATGASLSSTVSSSSSSSSLSPPDNYHYSVKATPTVPLDTVTAARGTRAVLKCKVESKGVKTVVWRREGEENPLAIGLFPFAADARITSDFNIRTNEWILVFEDVRSSDEGNYVCQISSKATRETVSKRIRLNVKSVSIQGTEYVEWGSPIQLVCNASGHPEPPRTVDWYRNGRRLRTDADRRIVITKKIDLQMIVSVLMILNVRKSDEAEYTCQASNHDHATLAVNVVRKSASEKVIGASCAKVSVCGACSAAVDFTVVIAVLVTATIYS